MQSLCHKRAVPKNNRSPTTLTIDGYSWFRRGQKADFHFTITGQFLAGRNSRPQKKLEEFFGALGIFPGRAVIFSGREFVPRSGGAHFSYRDPIFPYRAVTFPYRPVIPQYRAINFPYRKAVPRYRKASSPCRAMTFPYRAVIRRYRAVNFPYRKAVPRYRKASSPCRAVTFPYRAVTGNIAPSTFHIAKSSRDIAKPRLHIAASLCDMEKWPGGVGNSKIVTARVPAVSKNETAPPCAKMASSILWPFLALSL
jgi:hypothetical protein